MEGLEGQNWISSIIMIWMSPPKNIYLCYAFEFETERIFTAHFVCIQDPLQILNITRIAKLEFSHCNGSEIGLAPCISS